MSYRISLTETAKAYLGSLDAKTRAAIARKIEGLKESPEKQGKALTGDLSGYRSLPAAGRFRVVYRIDAAEIMVIVIAAGMRKAGSRIDVYETLKKLVRAKVFD